MKTRIALGLGGLPGSIDQRLEAIRHAGFEAVEVDATDLARSSISIAESVEHLHSSGLRVAALKELRDFTGNVGHVMNYRMELAKTSLNMLARMGGKLIIVNPSASNKTTHVSELVEQLQALATLAMKRGIRVGYRPLPWSDHAYDIASAWRLVEQAGNSNLGLVVDSFQLLTELDISRVFQQVPADKVFLVRLSDFKMSALHVLEDKIEVDHHQRFFPGAGNLGGDLARLVSQCEELGYQDDIVLSINDESYRMAGLDSTMKAAVKARHWLEKVATASV